MSEEQRKYVERLENVIRQIIAPLKDVPPKLLLELFSDEKENRLNKGNLQRKKLIQKLKKRRK